MKININDNVRVKLTDTGREVLKKNHNLLNKRTGAHLPYLPPIEDADGWSTWQLWSLMRDFGPHIYNGCRIPFETEIKIIEGQSWKP